MPTTSNFGWTTPADTDLVKDGAAAIRTLGNGIDTSLVDLKGGTTGQVLSKATNTDLDYTWITPNVGDITEVQAGTGISVASGTGPIPVVTNTVATTFDAKGDLVAGTGADTFAKLTVGANNTILTADSTTATGLKWATPVSTSALTFITSASPSGAASQSFNNCFSSTYQNYLFVCNLSVSNSEEQLNYRMRSSGTDATGSDYDYQSLTARASTTISGFGSNNQTAGRVGNFGGSGTIQSQFVFYVNRPFDEAATTLLSQMSWYNGTDDIRWTAYAAVHTPTTSYDGISLISTAGTMTGTIRIYGLANS